jgi:branched-subunit amino acid transport protein
MSEPNWYIWAAIACLCLATYLPRASLWLIGSKISFSAQVESALRYAPACALAAIVAPDLLLSHGGITATITQFRLLGAIAGTACFLYTRSLVWAIACGMGVFTAARLLGG